MLPPSPPPFRPNTPALQILEGGADLLRPSPDPPFPPHQLAALGGGSAGGRDAWVPALGPCVHGPHIWIWLREGKGEEILGVCVRRGGGGGEHTWLCSGLSLGRRGARLWRKVGIRRNCTAPTPAPCPWLRGGEGRGIPSEICGWGAAGLPWEEPRGGPQGSQQHTWDQGPPPWWELQERREGRWAGSVLPGTR